jgi:hypothetical protein
MLAFAIKQRVEGDRIVRLVASVLPNYVPHRAAAPLGVRALTSASVAYCGSAILENG